MADGLDGAGKQERALKDNSWISAIYCNSPQEGRQSCGVTLGSILDFQVEIPVDFQGEMSRRQPAISGAGEMHLGITGGVQGHGTSQL